MCSPSSILTGFFVSFSTSCPVSFVNCKREFLSVSVFSEALGPTLKLCILCLKALQVLFLLPVSTDKFETCRVLQVRSSFAQKLRSFLMYTMKAVLFGNIIDSLKDLPLLALL